MTDRSPGSLAPSNGAMPQTIVIPQRSPHPVWWVAAFSLAAIAACLVLERVAPVSPVFAQSAGSAGAHGVFAFTGQLAGDAYGVFMVDVDRGTLWCYRYYPGKDLLKLVAAREWLNDRYLKDFSTEPSTDFIKQQLEVQRAGDLQRAAP